MKRRTKYSIGGVIILVVGGFIAAKLASPPKLHYLTDNVKKSNIVQSVDATGSVSAAEAINLNFKAQGLINRVYVSVGDHVTKNQLLAELAAGTSASEVDRARAAVLSAQADLEKLLAGATPQQIAVNAEQVARAQITIDSAQKSLDNLVQTQENTRDAYRSTALQTLTDKFFVVKYSLQIVYDAVLDQEAQSNFKTSDTNSVQESSEKYNAAINLLKSAEAYAATAAASQSDDTILQALKALQQSLDATSLSLDATFKALTSATVNAVYTATVIDSFKVSVNTQASASATAKTAVQTSINNLTTDEQGLIKAYDAAVFAVKEAESAYKLAQAQYNLLIADPQGYEIKQQQAKVAQAQASLQAALSTFADTTIHAPLNGILTSVDIKPGEQASAAKPAIRMNGDSKLQIEVDIPESDITKIKVGDDVSITLDAYGSDTIFKGEVIFIEPAERLIQDVVYYRTTVNFSQDNVAIKPGMTANLNILIAEKDDVLTVPTRAVVTASDGSKTVRVLGSGGLVVEKKVTTGIKGDDGRVEILSGLSVGESVIIGENK